MAPLTSIRKIFLNGVFLRNGRIQYRLVSTSGKREDTNKAADPAGIIYKKPPDFSKPLENKNWISYGFDHLDKANDRYKMHFSMFCFFTFLLCGLSFVYAYYPDRNRKDWCRREAFILLHERESLGLDPVDKNYINPSKIVLPPDEELSEEDIVI